MTQQNLNKIKQTTPNSVAGRTPKEISNEEKIKQGFKFWYARTKENRKKQKQIKTETIKKKMQSNVTKDVT